MGNSYESAIVNQQIVIIPGHVTKQGGSFDLEDLAAVFTL